MELTLSLLGLGLTVIGSVLLYIFSDPKFGSGLMQEQWNPKRDTIGARSGFGLTMLGSVIQVIAVILAS